HRRYCSRRVLAAADTGSPPRGGDGRGARRRQWRAAGLLARPRAVPRPPGRRWAPAPQAGRRRDFDAAGRPGTAASRDRADLEDARRTARADTAESASHRDRRATGLSDRETDLRESAASLRHGQSLSADDARTPSGDPRAAWPFDERQGVA